MTNKINQATKYDGGIGDNKQDKPSNQIWLWNWLPTNKANQAVKYDGVIGWQQTRQTKQPNMTVNLVDDKQDKPNNQIWRWHWW